MATDQDIQTLFRYFGCATQLRGDFRKAVEACGPPTTDAKQAERWLNGPFAYVCYFFAGLHVVLEGWMRLGLSDPEIDRLRLSPHVDLLRRFRNAAFHFQRDYFDARYKDFTANDEALRQWADMLHDAFGRYFSERLKPRSSIPPAAAESENDDFELNL